VSAGVRARLAVCAAGALATAVALAGSAAPGPPPDSAARVLPGRALQFPRDYGSHPRFGIEWWYVTGWLYDRARHPLGFQITFFRVKTHLDADNPSDFTARQLLIAHCALSDPMHGRLWQDQRIRRAGLTLAQADEADTHVWLDDWQLERHALPGGGSVYEARVPAADFTLDLTFSTRTAPMPNGQAGFSQKGPSPSSASYYYSEPHLRVTGSIVRAGTRVPVTGEAWLDHEWASEYLDPQAQGWDWVGLNLDDGSALMAFEIRDREGRFYWAGGTLRDAAGHTQSFAPGDIAFTPLAYWRSPLSGVRYPVSERLRLGRRQYTLVPLLQNQEFDARATAGALYWEGAVTAEAPSAAARLQLVGRGYLELTGYDRPLSLR
jgi:predicted secreted hydrolase